MDNKEIKIKSLNVFKGKVLDVYVDDVKCPNGRTSKREIIRHPGGVCLLYINENNEVLVEKQFRYVYDEFIYELPAGKIEENEDPKEAAYREFEEETGYKANNIIELGTMYPSVGYTDEILYLYLVDGVIKSKQHLDVDEVIELNYIPFDKVLEMIESNEIKDAKSICLIAKYLIYKNKKQG